MLVAVGPMPPVAAKTKGENKPSPLLESVHHMLDVSPVHELGSTLAVGIEN